MVVRSLVLAVCSVIVLAACRTEPVAPASQVHPVERASAEPRAMRVLHAWDDRRAAAYSHGEVEALRDLYTSRSRAGRHDVAVLREYVERGLVVDDLAMQVLRAEVRRDRPRVVEVVVRERVTGTVLGRGSRWTLPRDRVDRHVLVLEREQGTWRLVSAARP